MASVFLLTSGLLEPSALAEELSPRETEAERLFAMGRELLVSDRAPEACPLFEESSALEPAVGTFLNLGRCYERTGRPASALRAYERASEMAEAAADQERAQFARKHAARVGAIAPLLSLVVPAELTVVALDGRALGAHETLSPILVDPGKHVLDITRQGDPTVHQLTLSIAPITSSRAQPINQVVIALPPESQATPRVEHVNEPKSADADKPPTAASKSDRPVQPQRKQPDPVATVGWVALAAGGVSLITGVGLSIHAYSRAAGSDCDQDLQCSPEGLATRESARNELVIGYSVGIAGGVIAVVSGVVLALLPRSKSGKVSAQLRSVPYGGQLDLGYRF